jgi:hypothetical protein
MPFKYLFEPVAQKGENIIFLPEAKYNPAGNVFFEVKEIQALFDGQLVNDFGSIAATTEASPAEYTDLYMAPRWLGQYRMMVLDDIEVARLHPRAVIGSSTESVVTKVTKFTPLLDPTLKSTEFFMFEDKPELYFQPKNTTKYTIGKSRVLFFGWALLLETKSGSPPKATYVPIEFSGIGGA